MEHYCHFHPNSPAKWRCNECHRFYDNACLVECDEKQQKGLCPFCQEALVYLPTESLLDNAIYPLKNLTLDSLNVQNFGLLFIAIVCATLISFLDLNSSLKYLLCVSIAFFLPLHFSRKFAYFLHQTQQPSKRNITQKNNRKLASTMVLSPAISIQLTILSTLLLLLPIYVFYHLHWFAGLFLLCLGGTCLPYLMLFSLHSSDDKNSIPLVKLFKEIKPFAVKLSLTSLSLYLLTINISELAATYSPFFFAMALCACFSTLSIIVMLNLTTKIFTAAERKLKARTHKPVNSHNANSSYDHKTTPHLDIDIDQALKTGQYSKVVSLLEEALKYNANANLRKQQLFLLLIELQDFQKLSRYAEIFLAWMLEQNKIRDASRFIYLLRKNDPKFLLFDLKLSYHLAKHFCQTKKHGLVLWLSEDAKTRFSPSEELAGLYLVAAQTLITHFKDLEKAEEYLLYILQSCSEFPSSESAKALLIHLQNNQQKQQDLRT